MDLVLLGCKGHWYDSDKATDSILLLSNIFICRQRLKKCQIIKLVIDV